MQPKLQPICAMPASGGVPALASALRFMQRGVRPRAHVARLTTAGGNGWRMAAMLGVLAVALTGGVWSHLQQQLAGTRAELSAAELRLVLAEARHAETEQVARETTERLQRAANSMAGEQAQAQAALVLRFRGELTALREEAARELRALKAGWLLADEALVAATRNRLGALERELSHKLAGDYEVLRESLGVAADGPADAFKRAFARVRGAVLFIRAAYTVRMVQSGEEQELTSYGTGFLISPVGVAMTAQHVIYPWRYDRRLQASLKLGLIEVREDSHRLAVWLADSRVLADGADGADTGPFLSEQAYLRDEAHDAVRILHEGRVQERTEQVASPYGMLELTLPRLGSGDLVALQLIDPARRFPFMPLSVARGPDPLDEVLVVGFPLSRLQDGRAVPQAASGRVRRAGGSVLELDTSLHPGNSGGPILDRHGDVVGMASAILDSPVYGIAVRGEELQAAWRAVRREVSAEQRRLREAGCDPGAIDGVPGARTFAARACAQRRSAQRVSMGR